MISKSNNNNNSDQGNNGTTYQDIELKRAIIASSSASTYTSHISSSTPTTNSNINTSKDDIKDSFNNISNMHTIDSNDNDDVINNNEIKDNTK